VSLREFLRYLRDPNTAKISRRYFVTNGFDGVLTIIGVILGAYSTGAPKELILGAGIGSTIGLSLSGFWSTYEVERAERRYELMEIEEAMLTDLTNTVLYNRMKISAVVNSLFSGMGPMVGSLIPLIPIALIWDTSLAVLVSIIIALTVLFSFGFYMGRLSKQNALISGVRMLFAGVAVMIINKILGVI